MTDRRVETSIITTMTGTDTMPLITAAQTRARIGSIGVKFISAPMAVAATMVA